MKTFITGVLRWSNKHIGMLVLRVVLGLFFMAHGVLKFQDMDQTVQFFGGIGFPAFLAYFVSAVEVLGGLALVLGVFTCVAGVLFAIIQLVAVFKLTGKIPAESALIGFAMGYGVNLVLAAASLGVGFTGPGRYALLSGRCCLWCRRDQHCKDCSACGHCGVCTPDTGKKESAGSLEHEQ